MKFPRVFLNERGEKKKKKNNYDTNAGKQARQDLVYEVFVAKSISSLEKKKRKKKVDFFPTRVRNNNLT